MSQPVNWGPIKVERRSSTESRPVVWLSPSVFVRSQSHVLICAWERNDRPLAPGGDDDSTASATVLSLFCFSFFFSSPFVTHPLTSRWTSAILVAYRLTNLCRSLGFLGINRPNSHSSWKLSPMLSRRAGSSDLCRSFTRNRRRLMESDIHCPW